ncbi:MULTISPECIES: glycosyltransferase [Chitinophagaceae]
MDKNIAYRSVLIAPLDWGLGHATRCIPIIQYFYLQHWKVVIACPPQSAHYALLSREFPDATFVPLFGYDVQYARSRAFFMPKMLLQLPKIRWTIRKEHIWLKNFLLRNKIDLVFSDNRYGLSHHEIPCIFMTHQLELNLPRQQQQRLTQKIFYRYINRFRQCWIPDFVKDGLAGTLSHPKSLPKIPVHYIGLLSRLGSTMVADPDYLFLILLSGPEPQRSILEEKMLHIVGRLPGKVLMVRGTPHQYTTPFVPENCTVVNHLSNDDMRKAFAVSQYIISRSGYTTVMEILSWQKKSILIPTPGQPEQEYLGMELMQKRCAYSFAQETENYLDELLHATQFDYHFPQYPTDTYISEMEHALKELGF